MELLGTIATIASLVIVVVGLPHQIYKNYTRKTCEGLAPSLIYASCCTYTLWALYGWTKPDYFLATSQTPGAILAYVLLFQLLYYRTKKTQ